MVKILLTNDDGVNEESIKILHEVLSKSHDVITVAPAVQQSGMGKAVSAHGEIELKKISDKVYSLSGTPSDCVQVGIYDVLGEKPDMVVSGINTGTNIGHGRNLSSGTVGAAVEAALDGVPAIASSLDYSIWEDSVNDPSNDVIKDMFLQAALMTSRVVDLWLNNHHKNDYKDIELLSLNMPKQVRANSEIIATTIHRHEIGQRFDRIDDKNLKLARFPVGEDTAPEGSDVRVISGGKSSLTPINLDLVHDDHIKAINKLFS